MLSGICCTLFNISFYLDVVAAEADAILQDRGFLSLSDVSHHVNLPLDFIYTVCGVIDIKANIPLLINICIYFWTIHGLPKMLIFPEEY